MPPEEIGRRLGQELMDDTLRAIVGIPGRVAALDRTLGQLEERVEANRQRIEAVEHELDAIEERMGHRLDATDARIDTEVQNKREGSRAQFVATMGIVAALATVAISAVLKALGVI
jgi:chromosome segregation ATPase